MCVGVCVYIYIYIYIYIYMKSSFPKRYKSILIVFMYIYIYMKTIWYIYIIEHHRNTQYLVYFAFLNDYVSVLC